MMAISILVALPAMVAVLLVTNHQPVLAWLINQSGLRAYGPSRGGPHGSTIPCPGDMAVTVLAIGQSNGANHMDHPAVSDVPGTAMIAHDTCYSLADPIPGASARGGSLWPTFGAELARRTGRPVVILGGAVGGTAVESWSARFGYAIAGLSRRIDAARDASQTVDLVVWVQGEADTIRGTSAADYAARLTRVVERIDDMTGGTPWIVTRTSLITGGRTSEAVRAGQNSVIEALPQVYAGTDTDRFDRTPEDRHDGLHLSRAAADIIARDLADRAATILGTPR